MSLFVTRIPSHFVQGIVPIAETEVLAPLPAPPPGPLPLCPVPLPEGEDTHIPPLVLDLGVAPGLDLGPLRDQHVGIGAEDCTGTLM